MKVTLNSISGIDDAICSIYISKGNLTEELEAEIRDEIFNNTDRNGFLLCRNNPELYADWVVATIGNRFSAMLRIGKKHITVLRYIDLSFTIRDLHRGAQDDLDAHAQRFNNRIIRSSSRLAGVVPGAKSDYYKNKILTLDEALAMIGFEVPTEITLGTDVYVKTINGYIKKEYADKNNKEHNDVERGLFMLSVPSNCIVRCNLCEFAHVYKMRNKDTHANPELKECIESLTSQVASALGFTQDGMRDYLMEIPN